MFPSKVKTKLAHDEPVLIVAIHSSDLMIWEMVGLMGFDGIWLCMEHHAHTMETAQNMMRAVRIGSGADVMARPARGEFMRMARMLEAGAHGILYPQCLDAREAAEVVANIKFPPMGIRGFDGGNRDAPYLFVDSLEYAKTANDNTFIFIQIETPDALEHVEEIVAVEGVDGLFFGPGDFTARSGIPGQFDHPKVHTALQRIANAVADVNKHWGTPAHNVESVKRIMDMGAKIICHQSDLTIMKAALEQIQETFGLMGFTFENSFG